MFNRCRPSAGTMPRHNDAVWTYRNTTSMGTYFESPAREYESLRLEYELLLLEYPSPRPEPLVDADAVAPPAPRKCGGTYGILCNRYSHRKSMGICCCPCDDLARTSVASFAQCNTLIHIILTDPLLLQTNATSLDWRHCICYVPVCRPTVRQDTGVWLRYLLQDQTTLALLFSAGCAAVCSCMTVGGCHRL